MNSGSTDEPLMRGSFFFAGNVEGIEALAKPIFVRAQPFNGWRPVPPSLFIQKHYAKSGTFGFRNELRKCVRTYHVGGSFFCGERGGDRSIGEANLRKGRQPLQWKRHCRPLQWKRHCRPLQWSAALAARPISVYEWSTFFVEAALPPLYCLSLKRKKTCLGIGRFFYR